MGFWGIVAFSPWTGQLGALLTESFGGEVDADWVEASGWRFVSVHGAHVPEASEVRRLAEEIGSTLVCAYVADSDVAWVQWQPPGSDAIALTVNPDEADAYGLDVETFDDATLAATLPVPPEAVPRVQAVLSADYGFAEDGVLALACAVGLIDADRLRELAVGDLEP